MVSRAHSIVGYNPDGRPEYDFYPTPAYVTQELLRREVFSTYVWEPACGDGSMSEVLRAYNYIVQSTDIADYGYTRGLPGFDFLESKVSLAPSIVTNPPFKLFYEFVDHAWNDLKVDHLALFGKLSALEGDKRSRLFEQTHLETVWVFRKRVTLTRNGEPSRNGGMIAFAWYVWTRGYNGSPRIGWI